MSQTVVLTLPEDVLEKYSRGAAAARKPLEEFLTERLLERLPPLGREVSPHSRRPEPPTLPRKEAELLQQINIGFSGEEWTAYHALVAKRRLGTLQPDEQQALIRLTDRLEQANARRIQALAELAQLRQTTLDALMGDLGIHSPGYE